MDTELRVTLLDLNVLINVLMMALIINYLNSFAIKDTYLRLGSKRGQREDKRSGPFFLPS